MAHAEHAALPDPETDPLATYVLEPDDLRSLLARVVAAPGHATHTALAPFTGAPVAAVPVSSLDDVSLAARRARAAQRRWATSSPRARGAVLLAVHDLLLARQSDGLDLVQVETGAARAYAFAELVAVARAARRHGLRARRLLAGRGPTGGRPGAVRELLHPAGVVAVVGSATTPLLSTLGEALVPLLAGDAVLLRPDPQAVLSALWAVEVAIDAGVPASLLQVLTPSVATDLVDVVDRLQVTARDVPARELTTAAAARSVPVRVVTGAPNPAYVASDVPVRATARALARACFGPAGPGGSSVDRVHVHERIWDDLLTELIEATAELRVDAGLHYRGDVGSPVSAAQLANVVEQVADAVESGARVLIGGERLEPAGPWFYAPTILVDVPGSARLAGQEAAGPVVQVAPVAGDDAAVAAMGAGRPARIARVWAGSSRGAELAARVRAEVVQVNDPGVLGVRTAGPTVPGPALHGPEAVAWASRAQTVQVHRPAPRSWDVELGPAAWASVVDRVERARRMVRLG